MLKMNVMEGSFVKTIGFAVLLLLISTVCMLFAPVKDACAAPVIAASPCDPNYYSSLEARALLEADREVTQNQNLIYKPDSVLSYTCFDQQLDVLGTEASSMFSESTRWGTNVLGGSQDTRTNQALENLVEDALLAYLEGNFHGASDTKYLGGRASISRPTPDGVVSNSGSYSCTEMQQVWMQAKCYNFNANASTDGFFTFEHYASNSDKRVFPAGGSACSLPQFTLNISRALTSPPWTADDTVTYLDRFDAANCGSFAPVLTGITVEKPTVSPYAEFVCLQPGCHYENGSGCVD